MAEELMNAAAEIAKLRKAAKKYQISRVKTVRVHLDTSEQMLTFPLAKLLKAVEEHVGSHHVEDFELQVSSDAGYNNVDLELLLVGHIKKSLSEIREEIEQRKLQEKQLQQSVKEAKDARRRDEITTLRRLMKQYPDVVKKTA
jgi:hypothetical protein